MRASEMMNPGVVSVLPEDSASTAARLMQRHNLGVLPVAGTDGRIKGILTDRDIVNRCVAQDEDPTQTRVRDIMTRGVITISPETDIHEASRLMAGEQVRRLPVVREGRIVGMLSIGDMARKSAFLEETAKTLSDISMPSGKYKRQQ